MKIAQDLTRGVILALYRADSALNTLVLNTLAGRSEPDPPTPTYRHLVCSLKGANGKGATGKCVNGNSAEMS